LCHHLNVLCHLQEEVRVLKKELEELYCVQEDLNDFVSVVAHDIRSPLTLIMGYADLISSQEGLSDDIQEYIGIIKNASEGMTSLLSSLEFYSSLREKKMIETLVPMSPLLEEILLELSGELKIPYPKVSLSVKHDLEGDPGMLKSMFKELLKNALLYCYHQAPVLTISSKDLSERRETLVPLDHPLILFEVRDEGIGFAPKHKEIIFQPLKRLVSGNIPGHGLGLPLARRICLRHGGTLTARSVEGQGSCFYAAFPRFQKHRLL
jgi:signal transduction histidine kinase